MRKFAGIILTVILILLMAVPVLAGTTEIVSVSSSGEPGKARSLYPSISADGRFVAFVSQSWNLVPEDTDSGSDVFVHDRETGITELVSVNSDGVKGSGGGYVAISADGRFVAFTSSSPILVPGDTNSTGDIFVHDRATGMTERVSVSSDGVQCKYGTFTFFPSISADGRFVAFESNANTLVPGDTNNRADTFVHDRATGTTERVSVSSTGAQSNRRSYYSSISADGRFVAFESHASNLVPGDTNGHGDALVHDRATGTTERVSVSSDGVQGNSRSYYPILSADGRFVAFSSYSSNLVPGDTNGRKDTFVHDRETGTTERISLSSDGAQGNNDSYVGGKYVFSADNRFVTFESVASNLVPNDTNPFNEIFVHDRETGTTELVSVNSDGVQVYGYSSYSSISADGRSVAFFSYAQNLVPGFNNRRGSIFVHDRGPSNSPPEANAGADQTVECGNSVTFDGLGSTDPDGDTLTYAWSGSFGSATGETTTVALPLGTHTITLTVDDGNGGTATDDVVVTVADTTAPGASATLSGTLLTNGWYFGDVLVEISATDSCSGVARITYTLDGALTVASGNYASETVTATGTHSVVYSATDNEGNSSADASLSMELFTADSDGFVALISTMVGEGLIAPQMENSLVKQAGNGSYKALANHIEAQTGKKIDPEASALLLEAIESITGN